MGYRASAEGTLELVTADLEDAFLAVMTALSDGNCDESWQYAEDLAGLIGEYFPGGVSVSDAGDNRTAMELHFDDWSHNQFELLLDALAPWVVTGRVDWAGEDDHWRDAFEDGVRSQESGIVTYADECYIVQVAGADPRLVGTMTRREAEAWVLAHPADEPVVVKVQRG